MRRSKEARRVAAFAAVILVPGSAFAVNIANITGGQIVRMNYASDGVTVDGTFDFNITGIGLGAGSIGFFNVVADLNFDNNISPQEWIVQNVPLPLDPVLTSFPMMSTWFDPGPFNLLPGAPYRTASTLEPNPLMAPIVDPSWHNSIVPANVYNWGGNDPLGQTFAFIPPIIIPPLPLIDIYKRTGVPDIAQQTNECGPTSAANSLRWLADAHGFGAQLPASNDDLIKGLMRSMTGSDARPFGGLTDNQLYDGKKDYISKNKLPIVVKGGNTSKAASGAAAFKFIKDELAAGEDVEFLIAWPGGGSHWVTAIGSAVIGNRLFLEVNDPDDGKTGPVDWELKPDGTFVNPKGTMLWAVSESYSPIYKWVAPLGSGLWSQLNWTAPGFPNAVHHQALFDGTEIVGGVANVTVDGTHIVNAISFYNEASAGSYVFSGGGLLLDDGYGDGTIRHEGSGLNSIDVVVTSPESLRIDLYNPTSRLRMGPINTPVVRTSGPGHVEMTADLGPTVVYAGAGETRFSSRQHLRELRVLDTAVARMSNTPGMLIETELLSLELTGTLDVGRGKVIVDFPESGPSPLGSIAAAIASAHNGGAWNGFGITSSSANGTGLAVGYGPSDSFFDVFPAIYAGEMVDASAVLVAFTRYGDANLDGTTSINDFALLASNFNTPGQWYQGDFSYDGMVSLGDFALLASNFNQSIGSFSDSAVPEPAGLGIIVAAAALRRRRWRATITPPAGSAVFPRWR